MAYFKGDIVSNSLGMQTALNVLLPDTGVTENTPVVYLLHGLSDCSSTWMRRTAIERYANAHSVAVIMPEVQRSFYCNMKYGLDYFTYVSSELIEIAHKLFGVPTRREMTYVAGLSMGGFGAMKCGLSFPERYNGIAAFSSVCDLEDAVIRHDEIKEQMKGIFGDELTLDDDNRLFELAKKCGTGAPKMFVTCGTEDFLYNQNIALRDQLKTLPIDYTYTEWAGTHTWEFWDHSIEMAFNKFFGKA